MYNFNLQQMIKEFNEINSLIIHPDNKNPFIQESLHDKLGNKALEISKFTSEKKEFTQTKSKVIDDYILEIKKIKDNCDLCIEYMSKIFEEIEKKRKELDIKEKELQNLDQNPDQNPDQKRLRTSQNKLEQARTSQKKARTSQDKLEKSQKKLGQAKKKLEQAKKSQNKKIYYT